MDDREKVIKALQFALDGTAVTGWGFAQVHKETVIAALELLKESEKCKTWGGYIDIDWASDEKAVGYQAVFNKLMELGLLKVTRTQGIEYTRYNWAIKAVKWDE